MAAGSASRIDHHDFEVVLVSYRSRPHIEQLLAEWPEDLAVVVVDNSDNIDGLRESVEGKPNARYLNGGGQGFGRAANLGAFTSNKRHIVFVNPDCRPSMDQLLSLVRGLVADPNAITHAATPVGPDGVIGIGVGGWEPSVRRAAVHALGLHKLLPTAGLYAHPGVGERVDVDWVTGTCMAVDRERFQSVGGFDEAFFVYCEDAALGHRGRARGWHSRLREDVLVLHGSGSSGAPSAEMRRLQGASFTIYVRRYGRNRVSAALVRGLYAFGTAWRVVVLAVSGHRDRAAASMAILRGLFTQRAYVAGTEVAQARAQEVGAA